MLALEKRIKVWSRRHGVETGHHTNRKRTDPPLHGAHVILWDRSRFACCPALGPALHSHAYVGTYETPKLRNRTPARLTGEQSKLENFGTALRRRLRRLRR